MTEERLENIRRVLRDVAKDGGIVRIGLGHRWYLGYGACHGWFRWLPYWGQSIIVTAWNRMICLFNGHVPYDDENEHVACLHCGKKDRKP